MSYYNFYNFSHPIIFRFIPEPTCQKMATILCAMHQMAHGINVPSSNIINHIKIIIYTEPWNNNAISVLAFRKFIKAFRNNISI